MSEWNININANKLKEVLEDVALKGKYFDGMASKNSRLSEYAYIQCHENGLFICNANEATACLISLNLEEQESVDSNSEVVILDIDKTTKILKAFKEDVHITVGDFLTFQDDSITSRMAKVLEHTSMVMIGMLIVYFSTNSLELTQDNSMKTFRKTTFESKITVLDTEMVNVVEACNVMNLAKYKFDYIQEERLSISSNRSETETFTMVVPTIHCAGQSATVEFTGAFHKFMKGVFQIHIKDDCPILLTSPSRVLVKAPYLRY
tara:strand:+ start:7612 stop:8400 length:789 start_codon:yes stop_codon:yes gene_type:complete